MYDNNRIFLVEITENNTLERKALQYTFCDAKERHVTLFCTRIVNDSCAAALEGFHTTNAR